MADSLDPTAVSNFNKAFGGNFDPKKMSKSGAGGGVDEKVSKKISDATFKSAEDVLKFGAEVFGSGARVSTGLTAMTKVVDNFGGALPGASGALFKTIGAMSGGVTELVKYAESGVDTFRSLAVSGASFNNNILTMKNSAAQSRLTLDEFASVVQNNSKGFAAFGGTVTTGAKLFTDASKDMFDKGLATPLLNMGMSFKDINEDLAEFLIKNRRAYTDKEIQDGTAAKSMIALSTEMDKIAKITGQNRKEMQKEVNDRMRRAQVQAKIQQLQASGNKEAAAKMEMALAAAAKAGPGAQAAVEDLFTKGTVVSEEGKAAAIALGSSYNDLIKVVDYAKGPGGMAGMNDAMNTFGTSLVDRVNSPEFKQITTLGGMGNKVADGFGAVFTASTTYVDSVNRLKTATDNTASAVAKLDAAAKKEQKPSDPTTQTIIQGERAMRDMAAVMNDKLIGDNGALTKFGDQLKPIADGLEGLRRADIEGAVKGVITKLENIGSAGARAMGANATVPTPGTTPGNINTTPDAQKASSEILQALRELKDTPGLQKEDAHALGSVMGTEIGPKMAEIIANDAKASGRTIAEQIKEIITKGPSDEVVKMATQMMADSKGLKTDDPKIKEYARQLKESVQIPMEDLTSASNMVVTNMTVEKANLPARAEGGPVKQGNPYIVGEEGPELFIPKASGMIRPNNDKTTISSAMNNVQPAPMPNFSGIEQSMKEMMTGMQSEMQKIAQNPAIQESMKGLTDMLSTKMDENKGALDQLHNVARKQVGAIKSQGFDVFARNVLG